jgi:hypothetical protein
MIGLRDAANWLATQSQRSTVAILVENVEHGEKLARLLPGWRLEAKGHSPTPGRCVHDRFIMTLARGAEALIATDIVIYAAAGTDRWFEHVGLITSSWAIKRRLIVDVDSRHDSRSTEETRIRAAEYRLGFPTLTRKGVEITEPRERRSQ